MKVLIELAFDVTGNQISYKNAGWIDSGLYDIDAKPEGDVPLSYEQAKPLLRQLLAQRFKLTVHYEQRDVKGYDLVVAKGGSKLTTGTEATVVGYIFQNGIRSPSISMNGLAAMLAHPLGQPVMNKTDIAGNYNINLHFAPDGSTDSPYPSIFTAVQEQLGLKLEPQKVPVQMLVIDHLSQTPTPN